MKNTIKTTFLSLMAGSFILAACSKEQAVTSESNDVTTTTNGASYAIDTTASKIEWKGYKVVKSDQTSHFGTIMFESGEVTVHDGMLESGSFIADMTSMTALDLKDDAEQQNKLNGHLRSEDFFETEKFPNATFEITKVSKQTEGDYNTLLDGNLTLKGITKPVQFRANVSVTDNEVTIATEPKDISREQFGVKFQMPLANGVIKDEINVQIYIKAQEKK